MHILLYGLALHTWSTAVSCSRLITAPSYTVKDLEVTGRLMETGCNYDEICVS